MSSNIARGDISRAGIINNSLVLLRALLEGGPYMRKYGTYFSSNAKRKISKSNKSELWNRLSYRALPYFFEVGSRSEMITKF
jgi:hypothetical protein